MCHGAPSPSPSRHAFFNKADYTNVPTVVFSHPPMATCGLTEPDARAEYGEDAVKVYQSKFTNLFFGHWQVRACRLYRSVHGGTHRGGG